VTSPNLHLATTDLVAQDVFDVLGKLIPDLLLLDGAARAAGAANALVNPSFEFNQRLGSSYTGDNTYGLDRWYIETPGGETLVFSQDATQTVDTSSAHSAKAIFTRGAGVYGRVAQLLEDPARYRGKPLAGRLPVKCATANAARAFLIGGGASSYSAYHPGDGQWHDLDVALTVDPAAGAVEFGLDVRLDCTAWADNATLVPGLVPLPYVPLHPADERARVDRYYEVHMAPPANDWPYFQGYAPAGGLDILWTVPWHTVKVRPPIVLIGGSWIGVNTGNSAPVLSSESVTGYAVKVTSAAAGLVSIRSDSSAGAAAGYIVGVANP